MLRKYVLTITLISCVTSLLGAFAQARSSPPQSPASFARYAFDGQPYDRVLSVLTRPRMPHRAIARMPVAVAGMSYDITDLAPFALAVQERVQSGTDYVRAVYVPVGVNNAGHIAVFVPCVCFIGFEEDANDGGFSTVFDDRGNVYNTMLPFLSAYAAGTMTVYALNDVGGEAGQWYEHDDGPVSGNIGWMDGLSRYYYYDGAHGGNTALAINDYGIAVGRDYAPTGVYAATFSYAHHRIDLPSIKNLSCVGSRAPMATGINDSGKIVGYACDRAVLFSPTGYAQVLPVGAAGVSTSAQAVNQHGDVVGSAGSEAFLYRGHTRTYLPRPAGETAGNAVAYAINASDEIVGDIVTSSGTTAFLYVNGKSYDLDALLPLNSGWLITHAAGINDGGQIVGEGTFAGNDTDGYSMSPNVAAVSGAKPH